ncbi:antitoxin Xre/MbcA/ParS toxin-binding domain-containing protein [Massilia sp. MB5]|uniref:antitoxin Xre/MbcA/ParS toxin-binding domain-containing protein n=1 Tax=Massilia sp. MB5 TaxID=2919578 RepID=UPI0035A340E7
MSTFLKVYKATPAFRIALIRARVKRARLRTLAIALGVPETALTGYLAIRPGSGELVPKASGERVIGLMSLIGRVESFAVGNESNGFNAAKWLGAWLSTPLPALGGTRPGSYLDTIAGQEFLCALLGMTESGTYA